MQNEPPRKSGHFRWVALATTAVGFLGSAAVLVHAAASSPPELPDTLVLEEPAGLAPQKATRIDGGNNQTQTVRLIRTFADHFEKLDLAKDDASPGWKTHFPFSPYDHWMGRTLPGNREQQIYVDPGFKGNGTRPLGLNPYAIGPDGLTITATRMSAAQKKNLSFKDKDGKGQPRIGNFQYVSGLLTTHNSFSQRYGYFETKASLPRERGAWSGFWMLPQAVKWPPEIDVMEVNNRQPERAANEGTLAIHYTEDKTHANSGCYVQMAPGLHTYGVLWTAERITYYTDRKPVCTVKTPADMNEPMYLILQLGIGPNVDKRTPDKVVMKVRWVGAYRIAD